MSPERIINSVAPIRICDNGGWTDTWFAGHGEVFNIGVYPYVEVQIEVHPREERHEKIVLVAENYGDRYAIDKDKKEWIKHPLLEAAIQRMGIPEDSAVLISIFSEVPAGCSTGTSASVSVALIGALSELTPTKLTPVEVAYRAHEIETNILHQQSGIQDQLCAAYGGINYIQMDKYPHASVSSIRVPDSVWWELERRLCLVYLGKPHVSSEVHEKVIRELEDRGPENRKIDNLRKTAEKAKDAIYRSDFVGLGKSMIENNEHQRALHPSLICPEADQIFEIAKRFGASGWKVNGAGGEGGSITILSGPLMPQKREMIKAIESLNSSFRNIPIYLSRFGLRVWSQSPDR